VALKPSALELAESLEQLRALEHGMTIQVIETKYRCLGVDTPADLAKVEALLARTSREKKRPAWKRKRSSS
jgi:3-deoxy-manno-octulosonate cytidylyltransferase (CMP-KDO synthetase)